MMKHIWPLLAATFLTLVCAIAYADTALLDKARALAASGKAAEAYQLLLAQADKNAGNPEYDYLLGTTAIDAGVPLQAVFALERVLDSQPDNAPARAELARAYFLIGENQAARTEFEKAKKAEMPDEARVEIDNYISAIDERILGGKQRTQLYLEAGLGHDSNVNSATASSQITAPGGIVYSVPVSEKASAVARVEAGGSFNHAIKTNLNVYGTGKLELYQVSDANDYSTRNTEGSVGLHFLKGREQYRLALVAQNYGVDSTTARNLAGLNGQWQHTMDARNMLSLFAQFATLKYPDASALDADQLATGLSWVHVMDGKHQPVVYLTGYLGKEDEKDPAFKSSGRDYVGLRAGVSLRSSAHLSWNAVVAYQSSDYHGADSLGITRQDNYINLELSASYLLAKGWLLRPEIIYMNNDSNQEFTSYTRTRAMVNLRKEF